MFVFEVLVLVLVVLVLVVTGYERDDRKIDMYMTLNYRV